MNAYEKAQSLGLTGETTEIVAKLQTLTAGPIPVANVLQWFDEQGLGELDPIENSWVGTLVDLVRNPQTPSPVSSGLRKLFAHLAKRTSQTVDTTDLSYSVEVFALLGALIQMGVVTAEQRDSFYALDGGRPYKDLSVEQFAAQKQAAESSVVIASKRGKLQDAMITVSAWIADNSGCTRDQVLSQFTVALSLEGWD